MPSSTLQLIQAREPLYIAQILATLAVSLGPFAAGLGKGYSSPALASLSAGVQRHPAPHHLHLQQPNQNHAHQQQHQQPSAERLLRSFTVSPQEGSWIASLSLLGALFGGPLGGLAMRYGRKRTLLTVAVPFSCCWLLTVFAQSVTMMYVTAFACGFCSAIVLLVSNVYISEIASPDIRGGLSAVAKMASHIGVLMSFSLGAYLDWRRLAMVAAAAPLTLLIAAYYVPETPSYLSMCGRDDEAAVSLQWLRGEETDVSVEWNAIQANVRRQQQQHHHHHQLNQHHQHHHQHQHRQHQPVARSSRSPGRPRSGDRGAGWPLDRRFVRPLLTTCGVMMFQRLSGAHAFSFYAVPIFRATFAGMNPHAAAVVVGFVQLLAAVASGLLIDKVGRLPLLVASNLFMTLALAAFGTFIYAQGGALDQALVGLNDTSSVLAGASVSASASQAAASLVDWMPLLCVLVFTVAFSIGVGPIAWLLISELYPLEFRAVGGAFTTSFSYACAFVSVKTFVDFEAALGLHGAFWLYAVVSLFGLGFVLVFVPETRGRRLDEMETKPPPLPR